LARSAGFWWAALTDRLDSDLAVPGDEEALSLLTPSGDRGELYTIAARHFARALGVENTDWPPPGELATPRFAQVLAVHMVALAAVEALRHGTAAPTQSHAVSAYLLSREYSHWQQLHVRSENPLATPPVTMRRAAYLATLTGALPRAEARDVLASVQLADPGAAADQIIDDHRVCYPPEDPRTVMEPLHPDRLGEDLIALATPSHLHTGAGTSQLLDDWTLTAPRALLADNDGEPPPWTRTAITVLVETSRRWPHVAVGTLYPLIRTRPELVLAAGGATLKRSNRFCRPFGTSTWTPPRPRSPLLSLAFASTRPATLPLTLVSMPRMLGVSAMPANTSPPR
jgi:hypothetical protein